MANKPESYGAAGGAKADNTGDWQEKRHGKNAWAWHRQGLRNFNFADVDVRHWHSTRYCTRLWWALEAVFGATQLYAYVSDGLVVWALYSSLNHTLMALAYGISLILSVLLVFIADIVEGHQIIKSDDISDCFTNKMAYRWKALTFYDHYGFFSSVRATLDCRTKVALVMYHVLKQWKYALIEVGQFVIVMLAEIQDAGLSVRDQAGVLENYSAWRENYMLWVKVLLLTYSLGKLLISAVAYPFIRCGIDSSMTEIRAKHEASFNLKAYCSFMVDKGVNKIVYQWIEDNKADPAAQRWLAALRQAADVDNAAEAERQSQHYKRGVASDALGGQIVGEEEGIARVQTWGAQMQMTGPKALAVHAAPGVASYAGVPPTSGQAFGAGPQYPQMQVAVALPIGQGSALGQITSVMCHNCGTNVRSDAPRFADNTVECPNCRVHNHI